MRVIIRRLRPLQNRHIEPRFKIRKKHVKIHSTNHLELLCGKSRSVQANDPKNTKYWSNETILKIGHLEKPTAFSKSSPWVKN